MQTGRKGGKIIVTDRWLVCECGAKLMEVLPDTRARSLVVYCRHCKRKYVVNIAEAGVLETTAH